MKSLGFAVLIVGCGFQVNPQETPVDGTASLPIDASVTDSFVVVPDAYNCFGTGMLKVCLDVLPTQPLTLPISGAQLDTTVNANCRQRVTQASGPELCVIAGTTVMVSDTFVAIGTRPLVVIGTESVTVAAGGTIDVSSQIASTGKLRRIGAGANTGICSTAGRGKNDSGGGGGGAGGSFGTVGGNGGTGDQNNNGVPAGQANGGGSGGAQPTLTLVRGGCSGGAGGEGANSDATHFGGPGGDGGGSIYLIGGASITIAGNVFASGAGGGVVTGDEHGGGGGGTGGMIGLDAPAITIAGRVVANGGAGGGGSGSSIVSDPNKVQGAAGGDGSTLDWNGRAARGIAGEQAGDGADGTAVGKTSALDGKSADGGGGGGAGGLGFVWTYGMMQAGQMVSPQATTHVAN